MKKKKLYYVLVLDQFGQPSGIIEEEYLTEEEARQKPYCYKNYAEALYIAID
ncbi:hypothetical protein [Mammaliicoccus vitulinus]|uniref:hypothetical protein n=1 Tax=Mammaliicoccus vitulinus TaxID=71237 RepID=UPI00248BF9BE|nr:hypothetical protein [Mammaliicoccus vitulinus]